MGILSREGIAALLASIWESPLLARALQSREDLSALLASALDNPLLTAGLLSLAPAALFAVQTFRTWRRLRHIGGPPLAGFTNLWLVRAIMGGNTHWDLAHVSAKYGALSRPLARIGPNELITSDPGMLRQMLGVRSRYQRSDWYIGMRFDPNSDNILSQRDSGLHHALRSKMSAGYTGKDIDEAEQKIDRNVTALLTLLHTKYDSTDSASAPKPFDFGRIVQYFTLDVISDLAYSEPFGCLREDRDMYGYIDAVEKNMPFIMIVTTMPKLGWVLRTGLLSRVMPSEKDELGFGRVLGICKQKAAERFGPDRKVQRDMLGSFVAHGLTQPEAESESLLQIVAGSETTATSIRATVLYAITNPRIYNKLVAEITTAAAPGNDLPTPVPDSVAKKLPYLQAVIKEGLRIWPPITGLMSKIVPPGGDSFRGVHLPEGTVVGYSAFGLSRNKEVWGEDADIFRPERWLEGTAEEIRAREAAVDLVFGHGRWSCLGKNVAYVELGKVLFEMLRHFDICVADPAKVWDSTCVGIFMQHNFWLIATRREQMV
ncbi:related to pisatin demethylase (cytochrome P450) [Cephalotrichum gorgonifer]|uniref:Related to pisatin demethylase (Cytochrome P450) n=1 Tax=Cephalotrichum gorgonifer TaxID=2041049 RepID=A0AAE8N124_9PEZI|nr:related to pisatin demethylase (cytochrome P450) [Cephalotrichum gorgonifer]